MTCFEQVNVRQQEEFCTSSLQYFTMHLKSSLVADTVRIIRNMSGINEVKQIIKNVWILLVFLMHVYHDARFRECKA
jgi:hypothetical protein